MSNYTIKVFSLQSFVDRFSRLNMPIIADVSKLEADTIVKIEQTPDGVMITASGVSITLSNEDARELRCWLRKAKLPHAQVSHKPRSAQTGRFIKRRGSRPYRA